MKKIKLKSFCDLQNGYAFSGKDYVDYSNTYNCRMSNIRPDATFDIEYNVKYLPDEYTKKYSKYLLKDDDLIIAMTDLAGKPKILGIPAIVKTKGRNILLNQRVGKLINFQPQDITNSYLKYALSYKGNMNYYKKFAGGGLQLNIGKNEILELEINYYNMIKQGEIVKELDTIHNAITNRQEVLKDYDLLIKSKFDEIFYKNEYPKAKLSDSVKEMFIGPFGSSLKAECLVPKEQSACVVYEQKHAIYHKLDSEEFRYVDEDKYKELKRFEVGPGDIIVSCRGTVGKVYVLPEEAPKGIIHPSLMKIRLKNDVYHSKFFTFLLEDKLMEEEQRNTGSSIKMAITAKKLGKEEFIVPSIEIQNEFINYLNGIEKQKESIHSDIHDLYEILELKMYQYFS